MWGLFVSEWLRYRRLTLICGAAHFLVMIALGTQTNLAEMPLAHLWPSVLAIAALAAGTLQLFSYKRPSHWTQLLHRPLAPARILAAIALAGLSMLGVALLLPYVLIHVYMDYEGRNAVELRHYLFVPVLCLQVVAAYLAGAFSALYSHRLAFLSLFVLWGFLPVRMDLRLATLGVASCLIFCWLLYAAWRPDLSRPFHRPLQLVVSELIIQAGVFSALSTTLLLVFQVVWNVGGIDPAKVPAPGTANYVVINSDARSLMLSALEGATHPDTELLRQQIRIGEPSVAGSPGGRSYPSYGQRPELDSNIELNDQERQITWHFSHRHGLFEGRHKVTNQAAGWLGTAGFHPAGPAPQDRFQSVPWTSGNRFILDDRSIYLVNWQDLQSRLRFVMDESERDRFNDSLTIKDGVVTLQSRKYLYLFREAELLDENASRPLAISARQPLPSIHRSHHARLQQKLVVMELVDGYLIAVVDNVPAFGSRPEFRKFEDTTIALYRTHSTSENELIHQRNLPTSYGTGFAYGNLVLAPGVRLFIDAWDGFFLRKSAALSWPLMYHRFPPLVLVLALLCCCGSALVTSLLLRRVGWPMRTKMTWILLNGCTGIVGIVSLYWGLLRRQKLKRLQPAQVVAQT